MTGRVPDEGGRTRDVFSPLPRVDLSGSDRRPLPVLPGRREGTWRPEAGAGALIGVVLMLASLAVLLLALQASAGASGLARLLWFAIFLLGLAGAVVVGLLLIRLRSIRYTITAVGLAVSFKGQRIAVPYEEIVEVVFRPRDRIDIGRFERFWPGYYDAEIPTSEGVWRSVATTPPNQRVRLRLRDGRTLAISPERPILFVEALESFRRGARPLVVLDEPVTRVHPPAGPTPAPVTTLAPNESGRVTRHVPTRAAMPAWAGRPQAFLLFRDRIVRGDRLASNLLALALILLILLVTVTVWRADAVGSPVPVHWNARGEPDRLVRPSGFWIFEGVWIFPVTAAVVVVVNAALATFAVYAGRLRAAQLLLAGALPVELLLLIALLRATG
jgi:hypothetical protein